MGRHGLRENNTNRLALKVSTLWYCLLTNLLDSLALVQALPIRRWWRQIVEASLSTSRVEATTSHLWLSETHMASCYKTTRC